MPKPRPCSNPGQVGNAANDANHTDTVATQTVRNITGSVATPCNTTVPGPDDNATAVPATGVTAVAEPGIRQAVVATEGITDSAYEKYKEIIKAYIVSRSYIARDQVAIARFRWARTPVNDGFGTILLEHGVNKEVVFSFVGQVLPDSLDLECVPEWDGRKGEKFNSARYRLCVGPLTTSHVLHKHYDKGIGLLRSLIKKKSSDSGKDTETVFLFEDGAADDVFGIKLSRKFFIKKKKGEEEIDVEYPWNLEDAHAYYTSNMQNVYNPSAFPAFDAAGNPIPPLAIPTIVANAVVAVSFRLRYYKIRGRHVYNADVESLTVLDD